MRLPALSDRGRSDKDMSEFFCYFFKTRECTVKRPHEWKNCAFVHPGEKAKRRNPRLHDYSADPCSEYMQKGCCAKGDACPLAHGVFETWLHPTKFCTVMCTEGAACRRKVCWFAHSPQELRAPAAAAPAALPSLTAAKQDVAPMCPVSSSAMLRVRTGSFNGSCSGSDSMCLHSSNNNNTASDSSISSANSSYYLPRSSPSPLTMGLQLPQVPVTAADFATPPVVPRSPLQLHSFPGGGPSAASTGITPPERQAGLLRRVSPGSSAMPSPVGGMLPATSVFDNSDSNSSHLLAPPSQLLLGLQQLRQQQQPAMPSLSPQCSLPPQSSLPAPWSMGGVPDSSSMIPVSIMPMLATTSAALEQPVMLDAADNNNNNSNSCMDLLVGGLLNSLEEQARHAQLQAANAQAAAAAASSNLQAVLSALGGLSLPPPGVGIGAPGVCVSQPGTVLHHYHAVSAPTAAFYPMM